MAKSKHSPALFEVVHGKKHFDKSATVLRTPNWWFKGRHRGPALPVDPGDPPAFADEADPTYPAAAPTPEADPTYAAPADEEPATSYADPTSRRRAPFQFVVDRERQELFLRVRYTTAIVAGFALVVMIALAYITGRQLGRGPSSALASQSSEDVANGPVEPGVMDVGGRSQGQAAANPGVGISGISSQAAPARPGVVTHVPFSSTTPQQNSQRATGPSTGSVQVAPENVRRTVGQQYVVIQGYAGDQRKLADEARDFLLKNNVPCTVENGVTGWPPTWHLVVGTQAFDRASGGPYENYIANVSNLGEKFAGKSAWKKFEPRAVRWKEKD